MSCHHLFLSGGVGVNKLILYTSISQILEGLGKGPGGPPLPRSVSFQVYPFPLKRRKLEGTAHKRFVFIAASHDDP